MSEFSDMTAISDNRFTGKLSETEISSAAQHREKHRSCPTGPVRND